MAFLHTVSTTLTVPYTVRYSAKAQRITLRIKPRVGLEVVLPEKAENINADQLLTRFHPWIQKHQEKILAFSNEKKDIQARVFPTGMFLHGGSKYYFFTTDASKVLPSLDEVYEQGRTHLPPQTLNLLTPKVFPLLLPARHTATQAQSTYRWLREWVRKESYAYFLDEMQALANQHNFSFSSLTLRFQKTRWGSCSIRKKINLNACLLFLPKELSQYILLHELCHTREMNHSDKFWREVFKIMPKALDYDKALRRAWSFVPFWASPHSY